MKKLIAIILAGLIALSGVFAVTGGAYVQAGKRTLDMGDDKGYEAPLVGTTMVFQQNLFGDFGIEGRLGISFGAHSILDGKEWSSDSWKAKARTIDYNATASVFYKPHLGNSIYLYLDAHLAWDTMTFQKGNTKNWDRTTFHSLSAGCGAGIVTKARGTIHTAQFTIYLSYDWSFINLRTTRQRVDNKTSSASGGKIDATGSGFCLYAGITVPIY